MLKAAEPPDPDLERQAAYWLRLHQHLATERSARRDRLWEQTAAIKEATDLYQMLDLGQRDTVDIRLRESFVALPIRTELDTVAADDDNLVIASYPLPLGGRPPLTRLIFRRSRSLALFLTCVYIAHVDFRPGQRMDNDRAISGRRSDRRPNSWAQLAGMSRRGKQRASRARVVRALDQLQNAGLVALSAKQDKYEKFELLKDDGSEERYLVPGADAGACLPIPPGFFYFGWHLVLEPVEIATYFAVLHASRRHAGQIVRRGLRGVALPESVRRSVYGLSDEAYETIHELEEFGLIKIHDLMPGRRFGRFDRSKVGDLAEGQFTPPPYRMSVLDGLNRNAFDVVSQSLTENHVPPRLTEEYVLRRAME